MSSDFYLQNISQISLLLNFFSTTIGAQATSIFLPITVTCAIQGTNGSIWHTQKRLTEKNIMIINYNSVYIIIAIYIIYYYNKPLCVNHSVQSQSRVWLFATSWTAACQASLSITNSQSLLKLMSIQSVMPSNHLILFCPLLFLSSLFPSIRVFSNESVLPIRWPPCKMLCIMRPGRDHLWIVSSYNGLWAIRLCSNWLDLQCHLWHTGYMLLP